jgi:hypothetical protein
MASAIRLPSTSSNMIQTEYYFGMHYIAQQLNSTMMNLIANEQSYSMNISNLFIQYGENWIQLTNKLFERDGFIIDIKGLYKLTLNIKSKIKQGITRSLKDLSAQRITRENRKLFMGFLSLLHTKLDESMTKIKLEMKSKRFLIECWDGYKSIFLEIGLEATSELLKSSLLEIDSLRREFHKLRQKITIEFVRIRKLLLNKYSRPFENRLYLNFYVSSFVFVTFLFIFFIKKFRQ